jgi:ATP-dependent Clp protease ATP-binding subunit ClpA
VRGAIGDYFKYRLSRPEILNRIGDNIVVFDFIAPEVAERIFDGMLKNVAHRIAEELKLQLELPADVRTTLLGHCTRELSNGGRGIGNALESSFINPLSRALFEHDLEGKQRVVVTGMSEEEKVVSLRVEVG